MRFNNRFCALMDIPDLPHGAFEHIGDRKIKPQGGGGGGIVSAVTDPISSALGTDGGGGGILGAVEDVGKSVGSGLADLDKFVGREIPGGWKTVGLAAATVAAPYALGAMGTAGAGTAAAADAGFVAADAASLAASGLSEAAIAQNLAAAGVESFAAADAAALAAQGLSESAIAQNLAYAYTPSELIPAVAPTGAPVYDYSQQAMVTPQGNVIPANTPASEIAAMDKSIASAGKEAISKYGGGLGLGQGLQLAMLGKGLLGGQPQQQQNPYAQMAQRNTVPGGAVDYSGILNLLSPKYAKRNPNSLLG